MTIIPKNDLHQGKYWNHDIDDYGWSYSEKEFDKSEEETGRESDEIMIKFRKQSCTQIRLTEKELKMIRVVSKKRPIKLI
jgi:hypothetical protein